MSHRNVDFEYRNGWPAVLAGVSLIAIASGCAKLDKYRGSGFKDSENWSEQLRDQRHSTGEGFSGVSTKANEIEKNLGVR